MRPSRGLVLALSAIAVLLAATLLAYHSPAPRGADAPPDEFSAYRAKEILRDLVGNGAAHPIGSPAGVRIREAIVKRLGLLGYATELQSGFACNRGVCGSPVNVLAQLGGSFEDPDAVLLASHYDSVPAGPGASDDGAGVAASLEIARILAARPAPRRRIVLLFTDGEEAGLLGALLFMRHPLAAQVKAAVNLEARGTSGPSLMFETGSANAWLMHLYESVVARPFTNSLYYVVYKLLPNDTDFTVFKKAGYQGFNFGFIGNVGRYHTPLDNWANASASSIQHQGDNALAVLQALANAPTVQPPIAEAVFFDGFARTLIAWPSEFTLPAALLSLGLLLAEAVILARNGALNVRQAAWGGAGLLGALASGVALCAGLLIVAMAVGKVPPMGSASWSAEPLPMHVGAAAIALLAAAGASLWPAQRAGFWGFWVAGSLFGALLAVACAIFVPGASYVLLLTAIFAALGALPATLRMASARPPFGWMTDFAALLPSLVFFAAVFPVLQFLYTALGSLAWPVSTLLLCFGTATLLPLLVAASAHARRLNVAAAALLAVAGAALTLILPTYSAEWPERLNLEYWSDADTGQSNYLARCDSMRLPAALAAAAKFDPVPRPRFAGSTSLAFYAGAPKLDLAAPELSWKSEPLASPPAASPPTAPVTRFLVRLRSARGAPEARVVFPASAHVASIEVMTPQGPIRVKLPQLNSGGATLMDFKSLPAAGVEFSFEAPGRGPVALQVFDLSYDFPSETLQRARPPNATSSQDGDTTVVHRTVSLDPAAGPLMNIT